MMQREAHLFLGMIRTKRYRRRKAQPTNKYVEQVGAQRYAGCIRGIFQRIYVLAGSHIGMKSAPNKQINIWRSSPRRSFARVSMHRQYCCIAAMPKRSEQIQSHCLQYHPKVGCAPCTFEAVGHPFHLSNLAATFPPRHPFSGTCHTPTRKLSKQRTGTHLPPPWAPMPPT